LLQGSRTIIKYPKLSQEGGKMLETHPSLIKGCNSYGLKLINGLFQGLGIISLTLEVM